MTDEPTEAADAIRDHESKWHRFVDPEAIAGLLTEHAAMVAELPQMKADLEYMVTDLYGDRLPGGGRVGGRFANGGIRVKLPGWLAAVIVALAAGVATIAAAIIAAVWGG